ncbi:MAG: hypothetical protein ABJB47_15655 [Actinomycetota bacterium]
MADRARGRARKTAAQAAPLARTAGDAVKQGADDVAAWAAPQVRRTRKWAAPRVEATGIAVQEKIAPQVSATLTKAARRLDPAPTKRPRSRIRLGFTVLAAAAGVAAAVTVVRKRMATGSALPDVTDADADSSYGTGPVGVTEPADATQVDTSRVDANGHVHTTP